MDLIFKKLYEKADNAGRNAAYRSVPTPMIVGTAKNLFDTELDYSKPVEVVNDGVCGFAWINFSPGTSRLAKWLKKNKLARKDDYYGGVTIWVSDYNQSMQRKEAYANAFAKVFIDFGYERTYSMSRMD